MFEIVFKSEQYVIYVDKRKNQRPWELQNKDLEQNQQLNPRKNPENIMLKKNKKINLLSGQLQIKYSNSETDPEYIRSIGIQKPHRR